MDTLLLIVWKLCAVKNRYKSLALNNHCCSPSSTLIAAATVAFSYWRSFSIAQDWCTEQLLYVICASYAMKGTPSQGDKCTACGFSHRTHQWLIMTSPGLSLYNTFCSSALQPCMVKKKTHLLRLISLTQASLKAGQKHSSSIYQFVVSWFSPVPFFALTTLLAGVWSYPQRHLLAGTR